MPQEEGAAPLLVFLIDADGDDREEAQHILRDSGITVCATASAREARYELERAVPDIVIWAQDPDSPAHCSLFCGFNNDSIRSDIVVLMPEPGKPAECEQICKKPGREIIPVVSIVPKNHRHPPVSVSDRRGWR